MKVHCALGLAVIVAVGSAFAAQSDDGLLFRLGFEGTLSSMESSGSSAPLYSDKVSLRGSEGQRNFVTVAAGGRLAYEGSGNVFMPSGSLAFWWLPSGGITDVEADVANISSFQRMNFSRWIRVFMQGGSLHASLYHGNSSGEGPTQVNAAPQSLEKGKWNHIVVTWDFAHGFALYVNGKLAQHAEGRWFHGGNINHLSLGMLSPGYVQAGTAAFEQSFADVRIYDFSLDQQQVRELTENKQLAPHSPTTIADSLEERGVRLGLKQDNVPVAEASDGGAQSVLWLRQLSVAGAKDVRRTTFAAFDGDWGRGWPLFQGYSDSGQQLKLDRSSSEEFNVIQAFGSGPMDLQSESPSRTFISIPATLGMSSVVLEAPSSAKELVVRRKGGVLFDLELMATQSAAMPVAGSGGGWEFGSLQPIEREGDKPAVVREEFAPYDRQTFLVDEINKGASTATLPAYKAIHIFGPKSEKETGLSAIALDIALIHDIPKTSIFCEIIDPINYERKAFSTVIQVKAAKAGSHIRFVIQPRKLVFGPAVRPQVIIYLGNSAEISCSDSRIGFKQVLVDEAKDEFLANQTSYFKDTYQELNEARPWRQPPGKVKWLRSFFKSLEAAKQLSGNNEEITAYWNWTHTDQEPVAPEMPNVPNGLAPWAVYTDAQINLFLKAAHWWIDNRQSSLGEFGASDGINDDTDLIEDWLALDRMRGPDVKIRSAIERVADNSWYLTTVNGMSKQTTDTLHSYEWGINSQCFAFLLNYGDPVYFQRLLTFTQQYSRLTTDANPDHRLHFKSWFYGSNEIRTEGPYGADHEINALLLQPAMLLSWYNGDTYAYDILKRWTDSMMEISRATDGKVMPASVLLKTGQTKIDSTWGAGFPDAVWALYDQTGAETYKNFAGSIVHAELELLPSKGIDRSRSIAISYLNSGGDDALRTYYMRKARDPDLGKKILHNNNYVDLDAFYAAWLITKDDGYLNQGSYVALKQIIWGFPMVTSAEGSTDRVWLPERLANRMVLGDLAMLRNEIYPKLAVSWENLSCGVTPLVRAHRKDCLEVEVVNLGTVPATANARIWELEHGEYEINIRSTSGESSFTKTLARGSKIQLTLSPGSNTILIHQKMLLDDIRKRCDLAISKLDAAYNKDSKKLTVFIYNIGSTKSGAYRVQASVDGHNILAREYAGLDAPSSFRAAKVSFEIPIADPEQEITVHAELSDDKGEITDSNNEIKIKAAEVTSRTQSIPK